jgi:hypothetical protein
MIHAVIKYISQDKEGGIQNTSRGGLKTSATFDFPLKKCPTSN